MLSEERHSVILDLVNKNHSVHLAQLCEVLKTSESTIRRDLKQLDEMGLLIKVHGGAMSKEDSFATYEYNMEEKAGMHVEVKEQIARFAASLVEDGDFIFIDAGSTTEKMADFIAAQNITVVTNAFMTARKLARRGFRVLVPSGEIKVTTEAIVGLECVESLRAYHFTKCFMGTNSVSLNAGYTTPDRRESGVKSIAMKQSREVFMLVDSSKFGKTASITFAELGDAKIITDKPVDKKYLAETSVWEV